MLLFDYETLDILIIKGIETNTYTLKFKDPIKVKITTHEATYFRDNWNLGAPIFTEVRAHVSCLQIHAYGRTRQEMLRELGYQIQRILGIICEIS